MYKHDYQVFNEIRTGLKVPTQVFSFLGEAFKIIFAGGKPKTRKANSVDPAKTLLNTTQEMQILGVVSLLARDAVGLDDLAEMKLKSPGKSNPKVEKRSDDDDEELADAIIQDGRILNLFSQLLGLSKRTSGTTTKNETLSGFDEDKNKASGNKVEGFNIEAFVRNFSKSLGELQASVPDIYRGVREAYKLLEQVGGLAAKIREYFEEL
ncbi:unnamed protein product [Allacma fusca]|uniref:Uncharacterized protein n=1 Tax=Allacma fusca TaxID=39272 RepID=A0A8J2K5Z4_9HEXA|nr:unnamed protein product [Allacma fusca]